MPDIEVVPDMLVAAMAELTESAAALVDRSNRGPRPRAVRPVGEASSDRQGGASEG
jgi:hypothetical protein